VPARRQAFSVTATGLAPTYQWQKDTVGNNLFANIGGATSSSYTTPGKPSPGMTAHISSAWSAYLATVRPRLSTAALLTVTCNTATTSNPGNQSVLAGQTATFSVTGGGSSPTYQWQKDTAGNNSFANISGATSSTYNHADNRHRG